MSDLACGCRINPPHPDRLCSYHEGFEDGFAKGREAAEARGVSHLSIQYVEKVVAELAEERAHADRLAATLTGYMEASGWGTVHLPTEAGKRLLAAHDARRSGQ